MTGITAPCGQDAIPYYGSKPWLWKIIVFSNYCWEKRKKKLTVHTFFPFFVHLPLSDFSVSYLISSKLLLFENIARAGSLQHCTWMYLALPRSAMIYLTIDCRRLPLTGLDASAYIYTLYGLKWSKALSGLGWKSLYAPLLWALLCDANNHKSSVPIYTHWTSL